VNRLNSFSHSFGRLTLAVLIASGIAGQLAGQLLGQPAGQGAAPTAEAVEPGEAEGKQESGQAETAAKTPWIPMTGQWKVCQFGGEGDVRVKDGLITMDYGSPLTGVVWRGPVQPANANANANANADAGGESAESPRAAADKENASAAASEKKTQPLPRDNYELRWECRRLRGFDFLCAFTFPVADQYASFVMGGWGGGITGVSSIDGYDASDNQTTMFKAFDNDQWYRARVRVEEAQISAWVDGTQLFVHPRQGHQFDIRFEMDPCTPYGIANYECDSQIRNIQIRRLHPSELVSTDDEP
jgi:hypothetical protein